MSKRIVTFICCLAGALLIAPTPSNAQPLADRVPEDAVLYVGWSGSTALPAGYQESHLKALLDDSNIPKLFSEFVPALVRKIGRENPDAQQPLQALVTLARPMWQYPTAIYFGGVRFDGDEPMPRLAIICRAGADAQGVHDTLVKLLADADLPMHAFRNEELVGVYLGYEDEKAAIAGAGGDAKPIGASAAFKGAFAQLEQPDPVIILYVDVERGLGLIDEAVEASDDEQAQQIWPMVRQASGLSGLKRAIFTDGFDGRDWGSRGFLEAPAPRSGLLAALDAQPVSDDLLKAVPQSSSVVLAGTADAAAFIRRMREMVGAIDPNAQRMFDQGLGAAQMMLGRNLLTDILDPLGAQWAMYLSPEVAGNGITGLVVVNKLDNPAKAEQGLVALSLFINNMIAGRMRQEELSLGFKNTKIDEMRVWYFAAPLVAPAWGVRDGNLYIGLYPQSVGAAARFNGSGKKTFLENEEFNALKQRLGVPAPQGVRFVDLPQLVGTGYQMLMLYVRLGLGFAEMHDVEAPEPVLPAFDKLMSHVSPSGALSWVDDRGWHMKGVAPFPGGGLVAGEQGIVSVGAAAMLTGVMLPSLNRAREAANRVKCQSNLRHIGQVIFLHASDHQGVFPEDFPALVAYMLEGGASPEVLICPSGRGSMPPGPVHRMKPEQVVAWAEQHSPYVYVGGGKTIRAGAETVLMYERPGSHSNDGISLLFGDGHVEFHALPSAQHLLSEQGIQLER